MLNGTFSVIFKHRVPLLFFQVRYTGHRDLPMTERRTKFETECCQDGFAEIAISSTGLTLVLTWNWKKSKSYGCEFVKEPGKVNGVK